MPRNGSGQYDLPYNWNDDKTNGIKVLASRMQGQDQDIATALTGSLASDGQTPLTGNLDFNTNKAVDLADGTDAGDAINVSQAETGELQYYGISATSSGGTDGEDYDFGPSPAFIAYPVYTRFSFTCHFTCLDDPIAKFDSLATKTLVKSNGSSGYTALIAGDIVADKEYIGLYNEDIDDTVIIIENPELPIINPTNITKATTITYGVTYLSSHTSVVLGSDPDHDLDFGAGNFIFFDGSGQGLLPAQTVSIDNLFGTGTGMLDTGAVANTTPYYLYPVYNPTTGDAKILATATKDSPTMTLPNANGYTILGRKIGSLFTDASANIVPAKWIYEDSQYYVRYNNSIIDLNTASPATTRTALSISAPAGTQVELGCTLFDNDTATTYVLFTEENQTDVPSSTNSDISANDQGRQSGSVFRYLNSSSQVYYQSTDGTLAANGLTVRVRGYKDKL